MNAVSFPRIRLPRWGFAAVAAAVLLTGCRSPEPTFLTLDAMPPTSAPPEAIATAIAVGEVTLPPEVDRRSVVIRRGSSGVEVDPTLRWAAPLDELVRTTLRDNLTDRLPADSVLGPSQPLDATGGKVLTVVFETFSVDAEGGAELVATWRLLNRAGESLMTRKEQFKIRSKNQTPQDMASAVSQALGMLADRIAQELAEPASSTPAE
ncbi:MAG: PqiC family protein [Phycisphaeraceae bacterium]